MQDKNAVFEYYHTPSTFAKSKFFYVQMLGHFTHRTYLDRQNLNSFSLLYTVKGSGRLVYRDKEYTVAENQAFIMDCMDFQHYETLNNQWDCYWLHFNGCESKAYVELIMKKVGTVFSLNQKTLISDAIIKIYELYESKDIHADVVTSRLIVDLLTEILLLSPDKDSEIDMPEKVQVAMEIMEEGYYNKINLDALCDEIGISKQYLIALFNKYTNMTPYEYLTNYRFSIAKKLLLTTEFPISEIAGKVGYNSTSHFIKMFTKAEGVSPRKFKESTMRGSL